MIMLYVTAVTSPASKGHVYVCRNIFPCMCYWPLLPLIMSSDPQPCLSTITTQNLPTWHLWNWEKDPIMEPVQIISCSTLLAKDQLEPAVLIYRPIMLHLWSKHVKYAHYFTPRLLLNHQTIKMLRALSTVLVSTGINWWWKQETKIIRILTRALTNPILILSDTIKTWEWSKSKGERIYKLIWVIKQVFDISLL